MKKDKWFLGKYAPEGILIDPKQFWMFIGILCMGGILYCDVKYHVQVGYYLNYLTFTLTVFVGGSHLNAFFSANRNNTSTENEEQAINNSSPVQDEVIVNNKREPKDFEVPYEELYGDRDVQR